jgi:hypothetical protein
MCFLDGKNKHLSEKFNFFKKKNKNISNTTGNGTLIRSYCADRKRFRPTIRSWEHTIPCI